MLSIILIVLFLHIAIYLVNTLGATTIDSAVRLSPNYLTDLTESLLATLSFNSSFSYFLLSNTCSHTL